MFLEQKICILEGFLKHHVTLKIGKSLNVSATTHYLKKHLPTTFSLGIPTISSFLHILALYFLISQTSALSTVNIWE